MTEAAQDPNLDASSRLAFASVEELVGGRVIAAERQGRWRPAWYLEVETERARLPVYFRGDRGHFENAVYSLEREMDVLKLLERYDVPVPHIYGFCQDPRGIVMERSPGRSNLATAENDGEREAVLDHYMELLAQIHRIPIEEACGIGIPAPQTAGELALADLELWENAYRKKRLRPEPGLEFMLGWLKRNPPERTVAPVLLAGDPGQFVFEKGRVTAVLDLELATGGDPMADLGGMRSRDLSEPLGDLSRAYRRYEEVSGLPLDPYAIDYHTIRFCVITPLAVSHLVTRPSPGMNLPQYLAWYLTYARTPLELIAGIEGIELEPPVLPAPSTSRFTPGYEALRSQLEGRGPDAERDYETDTAYRTAQYLEQVDRYGQDVREEDLDEVGQLVGRPLKDTADADQALEAFVLAAGPQHDAELVRLLHRRFARHENLLRPAMRELADARIAPLDLASPR